MGQSRRVWSCGFRKQLRFQFLAVTLVVLLSSVVLGGTYSPTASDPVSAPVSITFGGNSENGSLTSRALCGLTRMALPLAP